MTLSTRSILGGYRAVFVACIVALSVLTIARSGGTHPHAEHTHAAVVGAVEIVTALLFLVRRTQIVGVAGLLGVFGIATVISVASGQAPFHLILYAASAVAIVLLDRAVTHSE